MENIIFHQDNAPSHTTGQIQLELDLLEFDRISYLSGPSANGFRHVSYPKTERIGQQFTNLEELKH